jgi:hypothetical protein
MSWKVSLQENIQDSKTELRASEGRFDEPRKLLPEGTNKGTAHDSADLDVVMMQHLIVDKQL